MELNWSVCVNTCNFWQFPGATVLGVGGLLGGMDRRDEWRYLYKRLYVSNHSIRMTISR